ncbi:MAG TPA: NADH-quinone oxidoreductase subunit J [Terriglobales bacterium]|nr:NADH-quinone oxidoreductase subunit J [Terriglobales bacterium]
MQQLLFFLFAAICVAGAINLLAQRHPISSALSLIVVMGSLAVIYLLLGAEFVAAIQLIVYAGAIMVLFVFVIMLLNAGEEERTPGSRVAWLFGYPAVAILAGLLTWVFLHGGRQVAGAVPLGGPLAASAGSLESAADAGTAVNIGRLLFHDFLLPFEVTSVLVLIAIMGAVVLARRGEE